MDSKQIFAKWTLKHFKYLDQNFKQDFVDRFNNLCVVYGIKNDNYNLSYKAYNWLIIKHNNIITEKDFIEYIDTIFKQNSKSHAYPDYTNVLPELNVMDDPFST